MDAEPGDARFAHIPEPASSASTARPPRARPQFPRAASARTRPSGKAKARQLHTLEHRILLTATMCLLAFGAVMVYSATSATALLQGAGNGTSYLVKFVAYGAVGLVAMHVLARDGVAKAQTFVAPLLAVSFVLVLAVHIPHLGVAVNGAQALDRPGPAAVRALGAAEARARALRGDAAGQAPTARARPARAVQAAADRRGRRLPAGRHRARPRHRDGDRVHDRGAAGRGGHTRTQPRDRRRHGVRRVVLYALARPYARARLTSFIDPWAHASGSGFQAVQGQIAIGSGGLFGVGPGQSVQKIFYLPEAPTDFILAVIGEELGVVGVCALLFLYGLIAYAGLRVAKGARSLLQRADRRRRDLADRLPGAAQRVRRARPRAADGRAAAVRLLRLQQPDRDARGDGPAAERGRRAAPRTCGRCRPSKLRPAHENRQDGAVTQTRIVIAAGGTAGHVVPALAVADALRADGAEVAFIGGERAEAELVPAAGYELRTISVEGMSRTHPLRAAARAGARRARAPARASASCESCARTRCSAAAATSRGRSAWPR